MQISFKLIKFDTDCSVMGFTTAKFFTSLMNVSIKTALQVRHVYVYSCH